MYPVVKINYSSPALNTHSCRWILLHNVNLAQIQLEVQQEGETVDFLHYFTLPNHLDNNSIVRLLQDNMAAYQL